MFLFNKKLTFLSIFAFFTISSFSFAQTGESYSYISDNADFWSEYPAEDLTNFLISKMSDEELLAQILMFGWAGAEPSDLLNRWVTERGLGSVKVFGWNTDNTDLVAKSVGSVQKRSQNRHLRIPLFVATDQEGGWIRHVKGDTTDTPGNMAIGASQYPSDAYWSGYYLSKEISALGINMNFAPTVDLYTNRQSSVIGPRSFGEDPEFVGQLGASFVAGSIDAGVIPTAKHFPGHGDTSLDSHTKLPEINIDYKTLESRELIPFKYLIAENIPAIMSAHLSFPRIIANGEPASLSKTFLTEILRNRLHYRGLIITDDMQMEGAWGYAGNVSNAVKMAIEAGNDIIIFSKTAEFNERLWTMNLSNMRSSEEFRNQVITAAHRVILSKLKYFKSEKAAPLYPDVETLKDRLPNKDGQKFFLSQACRSITAYKGNSLPFVQNNERILLVGPENFPEFFDEARSRFRNTGRFPIKYPAGPNHVLWIHDNLLPLVHGYDVVIFCVADEGAAKAARELRTFGKKVIILSVLTPVPVMEGFSYADTILLGYSYSPYTFKALFGALCGDFIPNGKLPLDSD